MSRPVRTRLLLTAACMAVVCLAAHGSPAATPEKREILRLKVLADAEGRDRLSAEGFDISGHNLPEGWVEVITNTEGLARLQREGFALELVERQEGPRPLGWTATVPDEPPGTDVPLPDTRYTDPLELESFLNQVAADHPLITRLVNLGTSHQGRTIWGMMISDNAAQDEDELAVLFSGAHHSREVMTPEVVMDTIDHLTDNYGIDPDITAKVDSYQIWCVPMVNPDGVNIVHTQDDTWRKNARDNNTDGIINLFDGVDLNRNYEWGWGGQCLGSSGTPLSGTYHGPSEASEPETRAMVELGRTIRPVFDVEYHSFGEDVLYAMSCDPNVFSPTLSTIVDPDKSISRVIGEEYASRIVQADGQLGFTPAPFGSRVDGVGRDHQYHENGAISFVTEVNSSLEGSFRPDFALWRDPTVEGQRAGWLWLVDRIAGPAVGGLVLDAVTGTPVAADISLDQMQIPDGKRQSSRQDTGRFHIIVVPGFYTLRVSAPGYDEAVVFLNVGTTWNPVQVDLQPLGSSTIIAEDFEDSQNAAAWTVGPGGGTSVFGQWEWGEPEGTHVGDAQGGTLQFGNARFDRTPGEGSSAFVTGNLTAAGFTDDDVDNGTTTLTSPGFNLGGFYAVEASWHRWFRNDPLDPLDTLVAEVSADGGQTWEILEILFATTATADASPAWVPTSVRLDDLVALGPDIRLRFKASDTGADHTVEAAIDDLEIRGFSLPIQGEINGVRVTDRDNTVLQWDPLIGAGDAVYDVVRGALASLSGGPAGVDLGPLACIEEDSPDTATSGNPDTTTPPPGTGWFYTVRFNLGFTTGGWGAGSEGGTREGTGGCLP